MKTKLCLITVLLVALAGCGSKPQVVIPPDADLRADLLIQGSGEARTVEVSFYFSRSVAPGVKTEPPVEVVPVEDARFNDVPLTGSPNASGRLTYTAKDLQLKPGNVITARLNGRLYEGKVIPLTTLQTRSATAIMTPK